LLTACGGGGGGGDSTPPPQDRAVNDAVTTNEETDITIAVLANDVGVNATSLTISSEPDNGSAAISGSSVIYTPETDFSGTDTFQYQVTSTGGTQLTGTVSVTVTNINDAPVAMADSVSLIVNTPTPVNLLANDSDIDNNLTNSNIEVTAAPLLGELDLVQDSWVYVPDTGVTGADSFQYQINDGAGGTSQVVSVQITIAPITETTVSYRSLLVPSSDYAFTTQTQLSGNVLNSPGQVLALPANTISMLLQFRGADVGRTAADLQLTSLINVDGVEYARREVVFCDEGFCSALIPRRPDHTLPLGDWSFTLGTPASDLDGFDFAALDLSAVIRTGPAPDATEAVMAAIPIAPFLVSADLTVEDLAPILDWLAALMANNQFKVVFDPITVITDVALAEPDIDFAAASTTQLVANGQINRINIFFVDGFSGPSGSSYLGISGGLPGPVGEQNAFNGILINAQSTRSGPVEFWQRTTAEFAFHEMGHYIGLYHTTEADFTVVDVLDDTLVCDIMQHDVDENDQASAIECPDGLNPMFWENDLLTPKELLTPDQKYVFARSLLAEPVFTE